MSSEDDYFSLLEDLILSTLNLGIDSFAAICRNCKGAFPSEVLAIIQRLNLDNLSHESKLQFSIQNGTPIGELWPEPSPIDYEWRFTSETAQNMGYTALNFGKKILCLGTPTVFHYLISQGADACLIDRNQFIVNAFPNVPTEKIIITDISDLSQFSSLGFYDVVVMDPPWYMVHTIFWLKMASDLVSRDGSIIFPVLPELVRPSARAERATLFKIFEGLGTFHLSNGSVAYVTPLFEHETLSAFDIQPISVWRTTDLVTLKLSPSRPHIDALPPKEEQWDRFRFGTQVVGVKRVSGNNDKISVVSPYGEGSFLLRSVSARDPIRSTIGFWTSRNRVAMITGNQRVVQFLRSLEKGATPKCAIISTTSDLEERSALEILTALIGW